MRNFMVSSSLLKSFLFNKAIPTKEELNIVLDVVNEQDNITKFVYLIGILSRYEPNKGLINNDHNFYMNTVNAYSEALDVVLTEENVSDIAYCLYMIQEINRAFSYDNYSNPYDSEMLETILNKADNENDIYLVAAFRLSSAFMGLNINDFDVYQNTVNKCAQFYLKHFNTIQEKYGEIIRV